RQGYDGFKISFRHIEFAARGMPVAGEEGIRFVERARPAVHGFTAVLCTDGHGHRARPGRERLAAEVRGNHVLLQVLFGHAGCGNVIDHLARVHADAHDVVRHACQVDLGDIVSRVVDIVDAADDTTGGVTHGVNGLGV